MTGTTDEPGDKNEPIDADFEPAPPAADYFTGSQDSSKGPGWIALGITGVAAALFGGLIAGGLNSAGNSGFAPQTLAGDVETLSANQKAVEAGVEALRGEIASVEERLTREVTAAAAGSGDDEALTTLTAEIETLNQRLDALQTGENDLEGLSDLAMRVDVLERADEDEVTSPRLANRAITALRTRVEEIETAQAQITNRQAIRAEALADLLARMEAIEADAGEDMASDLTALRTEVDALKSLIAADDGQSAEIQQLQETVSELREQDEVDDENATASKALFALLTMEAAASDGRSFQSAYTQLQTALPGNVTMETLGPLANQSVPTVSMLQASFTPTAEDALAAIAAAEPESDGWAWLRNVFGENIELRRSGEPEGPEAVLDNAKTALEAQDLLRATEIIGTLNGPAATAFEPWMADATQRLQLDESLDTLRLVLLGAEK
ncbi:MAG: hypothetical protein AAF950_03405 [Pseudomonadota bacterium]